MPIDVVVPSNGTSLVWGPGLPFSAATDFVGPIAIDSRWSVTVSINPDGGGPAWRWIKPTEGERVVVVNPWATDIPLIFPGFKPSAGQPVHILTELQSSDGTAIESARTDVLWDTTVGLPVVIGNTAQGGFTATDRQMVTDTERRTQVLGEPTDLVVQRASGPVPLTLAELFSRSSLERLALEEVTQGETCFPVRATVAQYYYGVVVRVTTIAPDLVAKTPDANWYFPDLAVLRIFRGDDLQYRRGIHTPTFLTHEAWEWGWNILNALEVLGVPPDYTLAVDWREGCCGQVFILKWP